MTLEEAKKIAAIVETADGGCTHCVASLVDSLNGDFPEFEWGTDDSKSYEAGYVTVSAKKS